MRQPLPSMTVAVSYFWSHALESISYPEPAFRHPRAPPLENLICLTNRNIPARPLFAFAQMIALPHYNSLTLRSRGTNKRGNFPPASEQKRQSLDYPPTPNWLVDEKNPTWQKPLSPVCSTDSLKTLLKNPTFCDGVGAVLRPVDLF